MTGDQAPPVVFLVGFMGAGKTTVGRALAERLGYRFFDLDQLIQQRIGKSVREVFAEMGEGEFRKIETAALDSCNGLARAVVALGGGAYISAENREIARRIGKTVFLDCPLEVCMSRIAGDESRPLLGGYLEMSALLAERRPAYEQADLLVRCANESPEQIARHIVELLLS